MTCAQGLLHLLWGGAQSWSATGLQCIVHIVKNGYFILFALHKYISVIRTFTLSGEVSATCSPELQKSNMVTLKS